MLKSQPIKVNITPSISFEIEEIEKQQVLFDLVSVSNYNDFGLYGKAKGNLLKAFPLANRFRSRLLTPT